MFDDDWSGDTTRRKKRIKTRTYFGQTNMDTPVAGRKRKGKTAGGWSGDWLW